jgi:hypothetical protein
MGETIKSKYQLLIEKLEEEGKVEKIQEETTVKMLDSIQDEIETYRFENQQRIKDSLEEIATVVLTA